MFQVLVPTPTRKAIAAYTLPQASPVHPASRPLAGLSGMVQSDRLAVFAHLEGQRILCQAGRLWVTVENDPVDHVLAPQQSLVVPTGGKVIIGGKGSYTI